MTYFKGPLASMHCHPAIRPCGKDGSHPAATLLRPDSPDLRPRTLADVFAQAEGIDLVRTPPRTRPAAHFLARSRTSRPGHTHW